MRMLVAGVHLGGEGYPNARNTIRLLRDKVGIPVLECGRWLPSDARLWTVAHAGLGEKLRTLASLVFGSLASLVRVMRTMRAGDWVYVPHPGLFFLWIASLLPRRIRPRCILDAYISVWDSLYADRSMRGAPHELLRRIEARAWRAAEHVIVDTSGNREHFIRHFGLDPARVQAWPLAVDEPGSDSAPSGSGESVRVLYVGTLVPLHGVEHLAALAQAIDCMPGIELDIIGTGQQAPLLEQAMVGCGSRVRWVREWQGTAQVHDWIARSDICLGVFGGTGKASRVLPFKLYQYFAQGRAVISQREFSLPDGTPEPPIHGIDVSRKGALVEAVQLLAADSRDRTALATRAREYFKTYLSHERLQAHWEAMLDARSGSAPDQ